MLMEIDGDIETFQKARSKTLVVTEKITAISTKLKWDREKIRQVASLIGNELKKMISTPKSYADDELDYYVRLKPFFEAGCYKGKKDIKAFLVANKWKWKIPNESADAEEMAADNAVGEEPEQPEQSNVVPRYIVQNFNYYEA